MFSTRSCQHFSTRPFLALALCFTTVACTSQHKDTAPMDAISALDLHQSLLTLDSHVDTPLRLMGEGIDLGLRYDSREVRSKIDFARMDEGGLDAVFFAIWTAQGARTDSGHLAVKQKALDMLSLTKQHLSNYPEKAALALGPNDASEIASQGKHAIYFGLENGYPIGKDMNNIDQFYDLGVRYITLCHTKNNEICDSSTDDPEFNGLSPLGESVVRRMNSLGMMVDVSHASDKTVRDVLQISNAPVIASHSCVQSICSHARNLNDALITAIAEKGGVIQLALFSEYIMDEKPNPGRDSARTAFSETWGRYQDLDERAQADYRKARQVLDATYPRFLPTVSDAIDHIDYIVDLVGIDHVGIGSDLDGGGELADCYDVTGFPRITAELLKRGYSPEDIQKIWSGNLLRVFREVEAVADRSA